MSRKIFLITILVLILIIIAALLYLFVFGSKPQEIGKTPAAPESEIALPANPAEPPVASLPQIPEVSKITQVIASRVLGFALSGNSMFYYDEDQGGFYRKAQAGDDAVIYGQGKFTQVKDIIWSPDKNQAIMVFNNDDYYHYEFASGASTKLAPKISNLFWIQEGKRIFYQWNQTEGASELIVAEPDGNNWAKIRDLGYNKILLGSSPKIDGPIAMAQNYGYGEGRNVYPIFNDGAAGPAIKLSNYGEKAKWSRTGERILYEATDPDTFDNYLWVVDFSGTNNYSLGVKSFVEKCVWNKTDEKIFCAVPSQALGAKAEAADSSIDNFWELNTKTGEKRKVYDESESDAKFDANNLWLSGNEDRLYFTDEKTGVYALRLD